ncbi:hypothetical protein GGR58DRAFT_325636 [Xylaria digitata]|nr:hypothetical protein GGR58DRAFT_325636 [Xylaria digitata]
MPKGGIRKYPDQCPRCKLSEKEARCSRNNWGRHILRCKGIGASRHFSLCAQLSFSSSSPSQSEDRVSAPVAVASPNDPVTEFLSTPDGPLYYLAQAFKQAIDRSRGISSSSAPPEADKWRALSLDPPEIFPAGECWVKRPLYDVFLNDLLHAFDKSTTKVYLRGKPNDPHPDVPMLQVIRQLEAPKVAETYYATNLYSEMAELRIPERFASRHAPYYNEDGIWTTTNITPKYTFVDLHIDHGRHGITTLHGGCIKIFALYCPTPHNLEVVERHCDSDDIFIHTWDKLEGGQFVVFSEEEAIYLPPGCIHATLTLKGGLVPGIEYSSVGCLEMSAKILDINARKFSLNSSDLRPFLETVFISMSTGDESEKALAARHICERWVALGRVKADLSPKVKRLLAKSCAHCGRAWKQHKKKRN